jgi:23S rRNA pseudouridine2457 synthase
MSKGLRKYHYYLLNKPYGYLCQFSGETSDLLLGSLFDFPKDVYSVGRLDKDSEGLLLLTNDNAYKTLLLDPKSNKSKTYWVQVEGEITEGALNELASGTISISHKGDNYKVKSANCSRISVPNIEEREPPIRVRKSITTSWISIILTEGKNRQVRKMTAAVGFPTLRLIRVKMDVHSIDGLKSGEVRSFEPINR